MPKSWRVYLSPTLYLPYVFVYSGSLNRVGESEYDYMLSFCMACEIRWDIRDSIIVNYELPAIKRMVKTNNWRLLNLYRATSRMPERFPDGIHPDAQGAGIIAKEVCGAVTKERKKVREGCLVL